MKNMFLCSSAGNGYSVVSLHVHQLSRWSRSGPVARCFHHSQRSLNDGTGQTLSGYDSFCMSCSVLLLNCCAVLCDLLLTSAVVLFEISRASFSGILNTVRSQNILLYPGSQLQFTATPFSCFTDPLYCTVVCPNLFDLLPKISLYLPPSPSLSHAQTTIFFIFFTKMCIYFGWTPSYKRTVTNCQH